MELHNCFEQTTVSVLQNYRALGTNGYLWVRYTVTSTFCDEYSREKQQIKFKVLVH
jgi:hypothetical protein